MVGAAGEDSRVSIKIHRRQVRRSVCARINAWGSGQQMEIAAWKTGEERVGGDVSVGAGQILTRIEGLTSGTRLFCHTLPVDLTPSPLSSNMLLQMIPALAEIPTLLPTIVLLIMIGVLSAGNTCKLPHTDYLKTHCRQL